MSQEGIQSVSVALEMRVKAFEEQLERLLGISVAHLCFVEKPRKKRDRKSNTTRATGTEKTDFEQFVWHENVVGIRAEEKITLSKWKKLRCYEFKNGDMVIVQTKKPDCNRSTGVEASSPTSDENIALKSMSHEEKLEEVLNSVCGKLG